MNGLFATPRYAAPWYPGASPTEWVVGASNAKGEVPKERPLRPQDVLATIYHQLGIDLSTAFVNRAGRPISIGSDGQVIAELV